MKPKVPTTVLPPSGFKLSRTELFAVVKMPAALITVAALGLPLKEARLPLVATRHSTHQTPIVPGARVSAPPSVSPLTRPDPPSV